MNTKNSHNNLERDDGAIMTALESRNLIQLNMSKVINYQPPLSQRVRGFLSGTFSAYHIQSEIGIKLKR